MTLGSLMLAAVGVTRPSDTQELAVVLEVSIDRLKQWSETCNELQKPVNEIDYGKLVIQLLGRKLVNPEDVLKKGEEGKPANDLAILFSASLLDAGVAAYEFSEFLDSAMATEPKIVELMLKNDIEGAKTAIRMSGPFNRKSWKPLDTHDRVVVATTKPKTASLFFDRVWSSDYRIPADIGFRCHTVEEQIALGILDGAINLVADAVDAPHEKIIEAETKIEERWDEFEARMAPFQENLILKPLCKHTGLSIQPFFGSATAMEATYTPGDYRVLIPMIESIQVIDESQLEWQQVQEIRKDDATVKRLRKMLHWLDMDLAAKPLDVVRDELALKLDDYEKAISKHGIKTIVGTIGSIIGDWQSWMTLAGSWLVGEQIGHQGGVPISIATGVTAKIGWDVWNIHQSHLKERDQPIAYLHEVKKKSHGGQIGKAN